MTDLFRYTLSPAFSNTVVRPFMQLKEFAVKENVKRFIRKWNGIYLQEPVANEFFEVDQKTFLEKFNSLKKHKDATILASTLISKHRKTHINHTTISQ
jgi:hypothetical protein